MTNKISRDREELHSAKKALKRHELLEQRGENRKVFRLSDGTEQAVFYPTAVHVFDEETQSFDEVDNTIVEEGDGRHYVNGKNCFKACFSREENSDELFCIEQGKHRVTVFAERGKKQKNKSLRPAFGKKKFADGKEKDQLTYEGVHGGADYTYSVTDSGVKEDIVVKEKAEAYRYPFVLRCENVTASPDEQQKRVSFVSNETGEEVFFIPAPYMKDAQENTSTAVHYEMKNGADGCVQLTVIADSDWINAEDRAFPVTIDPQINIAESMTVYSWKDGYMSYASPYIVGYTECESGCSLNRIYLDFPLPTMARNPRLKKAELIFTQKNGDCISEDAPLFGLYMTGGSHYPGTYCYPDIDGTLIDFAKMRSDSEDSDKVTYSFDITKILDLYDNLDFPPPGFVLMLLDESNTACNNVEFYNENAGDNAPKFCVTYEPSYGVNTSYRTHTHELGRFGQGSVDLQCGNLMFDSEDFAWAGNRMPVTIRHLFNSALAEYAYTSNPAIGLNTADFSAMKLGCGWKLNVMQSMQSFQSSYDAVGDTKQIKYVYIDENGQEIYFEESDETVYDEEQECSYKLYEDMDGGGMIYDDRKRTLKMAEEIYQFDVNGRLVRITDGYNNYTDITYDGLGRLITVTDGVGREFAFTYNNDGYLTSITAPDDTSITYGYADGLLTSITYPDGRKAQISYTQEDFYPNRPTAVVLQDAVGNNVYKMEYSFNGFYVDMMTEYGVENGLFKKGISTSYVMNFSMRRTLVKTTQPKDTAEGETEDTVVKTVYVFDDDGNVVSQYAYTEDTGNVGAQGGAGIHPFAGDDALSTVSNSHNLLVGHNFNNLSNWQKKASDSTVLNVVPYDNERCAAFGRYAMCLQTTNEQSVGEGVCQETTALSAGEYVFSAYLRVDADFSGTANCGAYLQVIDLSGNVLGESEHLTAYSGNEHTRLSVPFTLTEDAAVKVYVLLNGKGATFVDAAQLEKNAYATPYNMLENGSFERGVSGWENTDNSTIHADGFDMSGCLRMTANLNEERYIYQDVNVRSYMTTRETFTLSGWARGFGMSDHEREGVETPTFRLRAEIHYTNGETEEYSAPFCPNVEDWQYTSVQFSKQRFLKVDRLRVYCEYNHNTNSVFFDCVQLVRDSLETDLSDSDFATDAPVGEEEAPQTTADTAPAFEEARDSYGNVLTETTFTDGELGTIYRAFGFSVDNGNDLAWEQDACGNKTHYTVDETTSRNEEVTDRLGNKTAYEYDAAGRTTKVTSKNADGTELAHVSYAYDAFDNMTEIVRGDGLKYVLAYNAYHNLESIGIDGMSAKLATYTYKNGNGRLKAITYANGDVMKATYNTAGQMVAEKWTNWFNADVAHYKYTYDGQGNIVRSLDLTACKEYTYTYEGGKLMRAQEYNVTLSDEIVTGRTLFNTVTYFYDADDRLYKKTVSLTGQTIHYENPEDGNTVVKFTAGGKTVTSHSKSDSFGRKVFDELQLGTGIVTREFRYHAGEETERHAAEGKMKSAPTTQLVSQIVLSDGRTIAYEYDAEERITKVTDSVDGITEYTYDVLGQLLTETRDGEVVNAMTYDNYGNILTKNGVVYTYGTGAYKDCLMQVDGVWVFHDEQGNPTYYKGHNLSWEKGRQLKSFDGNTYAYNANGIRTHKTVSGIPHVYTLDGTKILHEDWGGNSIVPLYDNEDSVCGLVYDTTYYFQKNLQGDVIAITNANGEVVARYRYDAWGVPTITMDVTPMNIATVNPFRYRGYYYDQDTGLYYVSSRYYDPEIGRFLNSDEAIMLFLGQEEILGNNLFSYCENCPTTNVDLWGYVKINIKWLGTAIDLIIWLIPALFAISKIWKTVSKSASKLVSFGNKLISVGKQLFKRFDDRLYCAFAKESTYRIVRTIGVLAGIITIISSIGSIVQYIIDILDGKWDGYLNTNRFGPKLDLTRDY